MGGRSPGFKCTVSQDGVSQRGADALHTPGSLALDLASLSCSLLSVKWG